jgi:hypothetical protein
MLNSQAADNDENEEGQQSEPSGKNKGWDISNKEQLFYILAISILFSNHFRESVVAGKTRHLCKNCQKEVSNVDAVKAEKEL